MSNSNTTLTGFPKHDGPIKKHRTRNLAKAPEVAPFGTSSFPGCWPWSWDPKPWKP